MSAVRVPAGLAPRALLRRLRGHGPAAAAGLALLALAAAAAAAPLLPLADPAATDLAARLAPPLSDGHPLGTDALGRDVLSRLVWGARLSLAVALFAVAIAAVAGSAIGLVSAYRGRAADAVLMRGVDVLMAFPYLLLALAIVAALGPGLRNAAIAIAIVNVPFFARTVRGTALALMREDFVAAARVSGYSDARILLAELAPNAAPVIVIAISTSLGWMILETAGLSFLGLGAQPPLADLGGMLGEGRHLMATAPHLSLVPGAAIFAIVVALNVLGDGLRDALDPEAGATGVAAPADRAAAHDGPPDRDAAPLLAVRGLRVAFARDGGGERGVLHDVGFEVRAGDRVALVGESGSGKSVTALSLLGLLAPGARVSAGSVHLDGQDLLGLAPARRRALLGRRMAYVPQDPQSSLHPMLRVGRQVEEAIEVHAGHAGTRDVRERSLRLLARAGLPSPEVAARAWPHQLSGGMRQRVAIAIAIANDPALLIADEPTTALDVTTQIGILRLLDELAGREGHALLFISHDLGLVSQLCRRVLVMRDGRIVEQADVDALFRAPREDYTRRLIASVPRLGDPGKLLRAGGAPAR